jgi:hypothetical protein
LVYLPIKIYRFLGSINFYSLPYTLDMNGRISTLQNEIRNIEDMLSNLSGPMLQLAQEELKNLQFENDILNYTLHKSSKALLIVEEHAEEPVAHPF